MMKKSPTTLKLHPSLELVNFVTPPMLSRKSRNKKHQRSIEHRLAYGIRYDFFEEESNNCNPKRKSLARDDSPEREQILLSYRNLKAAELSNSESSEQSEFIYGLFSPRPNINNATTVSLEDADAWKHHQYPYENVALSGGGIRGYAFIGLLKCLEDAGVVRHIRRYIGSNVGAVIAAMAAVGCSAQDISTFISSDLESFYMDKHRCCNLTFTRTFILSTFRERFARLLKLKTGNSDITFKELFWQHGKELCIVVTNVMHSRVEYCHHSTTPDIPIRLAVVISSSAPELHPTAVRIYNHKTIGALLMSEDRYSHNLWRETFSTDMRALPSYIPGTTLATRTLNKEMKLRRKADKKFDAKRYVAALKLDPYLADDRFYKRHYGIGYRGAPDIKYALHYMSALLTSTLLGQNQFSDLKRTIGINCGYIKGSDKVLEPEDREFLIRQGYEQTRMFLQHQLATDLSSPVTISPVKISPVTKFPVTISPVTISPVTISPLLSLYSMELYMTDDINRICNSMSNRAFTNATSKAHPTAAADSRRGPILDKHAFIQQDTPASGISSNDSPKPTVKSSENTISNRSSSDVALTGSAVETPRLSLSSNSSRYDLHISDLSSLLAIYPATTVVPPTPDYPAPTEDFVKARLSDGSIAEEMTRM